jgi:hypothetical protein
MFHRESFKEHLQKKIINLTSQTIRIAQEGSMFARDHHDTFYKAPSQG